VHNPVCYQVQLTFTLPSCCVDVICGGRSMLVSTRRLRGAICSSLRAPPGSPSSTSLRVMPCTWPCRSAYVTSMSQTDNRNFACHFTSLPDFTTHFQSRGRGGGPGGHTQRKPWLLYAAAGCADCGYGLHLALGHRPQRCCGTIWGCATAGATCWHTVANHAALDLSTEP